MPNEFENKVIESSQELREGPEDSSALSESKSSPALEKPRSDPFPDFIHTKSHSHGFLDWLFCLERVFIPEIDQKLSLDSKRSAEEIMAELKNCRKGKSDNFPEIRAKTQAKNETFTVGSAEAPWLAAISPTLQAFVSNTESGSKICLRINNSNLLSTAANAPLAAFSATLVSFAISSYLLPHPILLFYSLICTLPLPILSCIIAVSITRNRFKSELPNLLRGVRKIAQSSDQFVDADQETWKALPSNHPVSEKFIAGAISGLIFLGIAFGLHAQAWNYWVAGDYQNCAKLCEPVQKLSEAVLGKDDTTVADCKYYLAECYRCMDQTDRASKLYQEAEKSMAGGLGKENNFYADVIFNLGRCYEQEGKLPEAKEKYLQALKIWQKAFGKRNMVCAKALDRLAALSFKQGDYAAAREYQDQIIEIDRAYGEKYLRAEAEDLNVLAAIENRENNFSQALTAANESIKEKESAKSDKHSLVSSYINLARAYLGINDKEKAQKAFDMARSLMPAPLDGASEVGLDTLKSLSTAYTKELRKHKEIYEVPNFDTRADITYEGDGRL